MCFDRLFQSARTKTSRIVLSENGASDDIYGTPREVFEHILIIITAVAMTIPHSPQSPPIIIKMNLSIVTGGYSGEVT